MVFSVSFFPGEGKRANSVSSRSTLPELLSRLVKERSGKSGINSESLDDQLIWQLTHTYDACALSTKGKGTVAMSSNHGNRNLESRAGNSEAC